MSVQWGSVSQGEWNRLLAAGWKGHAGDGMEALYPPSPELVRAANAFADQDSARIQEAIPDGQSIILTVSNATAGSYAVTWRGKSIPVAGKNANYTPVIGHRVKCDMVQGQLLIDYRIDGQP